MTRRLKGEDGSCVRVSVGISREAMPTGERIFAGRGRGGRGRARRQASEQIGQRNLEESI